MSSQRVIIGNSLHVLKTMEADSIDLCITSPPYWGLRDYGSAPEIYGGDSSCEHCWEEHRTPARGGGPCKTTTVGANKDTEGNNRGHPTITWYCSRCGAWKGQLGLEPQPQEYIEHLCAIFDEVKRVLKPTGACWVNLGDTYGTDKSLVQIPSRFAIAMTERGWLLRNEVIWHKPNAMPSSVKDRFTVDFEKFYFFTKEQKYYFEQQKEPQKGELTVRKIKPTNRNSPGWSYHTNSDFERGGLRNIRTVWSIHTKASGENHCAMFPPTLIDIPIKACCPPGGTVLDPFCGSGTTLADCRAHNLDGIGIEVNPTFKEIIDRRMMANLGKLEAYE